MMDGGCAMCSSSASVRRACVVMYTYVYPWRGVAAACVCVCVAVSMYVAVMPSAVYACGWCAVLYGWHVLCVQW